MDEENSFSPDAFVQGFANALSSVGGNQEQPAQSQDGGTTTSSEAVKAAPQENSETDTVTDADIDVLAAEADEGVVEAQKEAEAEQKKQPEKKGKQTAQERIRELAGQKKEAEIRAEVERQTAQRQIQELQGYIAQQNQYFAEQMNQLRQMSDQRRAEVEEEGLTEVQKWERQIQQNVRNEYQSEIQQLRQEIAQKEQAATLAQQKAQEEAARTQRWNGYLNEGTTAVNEHFLKPYNSSDKDLEQETLNMVLTYGAGFGKPPAEAASDFKKYVSKLVDLGIKAKVAAKKQNSAEVKLPVPPRVPNGGGADISKAAQPFSLDSYLENAFAPLRVK